MPNNKNRSPHIKIVEYAQMAQKVWQDFVQTDRNRERIRTYFHLRPTNGGVTVVTTLNGYEMRGVSGITNARELYNRLSKIDKDYEVLTSLDDVRRDAIMEDLRFPRREKVTNSILEERIQATMINTMSEDRNLKEKLKSRNPIRFIASELIFERGPYRVDIVGYDKRDIYFFELKKERTKAVEQVSDYIKNYSQDDKSAILKPLLKDYPINPVKEFRSLIGVMVMEHAENSVGLETWQVLAQKHGIRILFYKPSLTYKAIV